MITSCHELVRRVPIIVIPTDMDNNFASFGANTIPHCVGNYHFIMPETGCHDSFINYPNGIWHI